MTTLGLATKDQLLGQAENLKTEVIETNGMRVRVRELTAGERAEYLDIMGAAAGRMDAKTDTIAFDMGKSSAFVKAAVFSVRTCVIGEDGLRLFSNRDDERIMNQPHQWIDDINTAVVKLSGMASEDLEEKRGNSPETPSDGSSSS
jgi:hypothetical protein